VGLYCQGIEHPDVILTDHGVSPAPAAHVHGILTGGRDRAIGQRNGSAYAVQIMGSPKPTAKCAVILTGGRDRTVVHCGISEIVRMRSR
jgi:hypothetical protein